jgi:hypothetical protein
MSDERKDLVPAEQAQPARTNMTRLEAIETEMDPNVAVDKILAAGQAMDRLTIAALGMTDSRCWDNMQGRPRLNAYGAHMVAKKVGLRIRTFGSREVEAGKDAKGAYFVFQCSGEVSHPLSPAIIPCQGTCDSRNKFHTTRYEEVTDDKGKLIWEEYEYYDRKKKQKVKRRRPKKNKIELQAHQVQRTFIAQQAMTLCKTKGVTEYLGLDRLTWDEVEAHTSAVKDDAASVTFEDKRTDEKKQEQKKRQKKQAKERVPDAPKKTPEDAQATAEQRTLVWKTFLEAKQWFEELPEDAAEQFYDWAVNLCGERARDKKNWTVGMVDKFLEDLENKINAFKKAEELENENKTNDENRAEESEPKTE